MQSYKKLLGVYTEYQRKLANKSEHLTNTVGFKKNPCFKKY